MARKSPLTQKQWEDVGNRYLRGESASALGREFGITEGAIRQRFATKFKQAKAVANQVIAAEEAFNALPVATRIATQSLIDELRAISTHLAGAAKLGSMTAHRLAGIANQQVDKIDDADPLSNMDALKGIAVLTDMSNKSAQTGLNLLAANKKLIDDENSIRKSPFDDITVIELVGPEENEIKGKNPA